MAGAFPYLQIISRNPAHYTKHTLNRRVQVHPHLLELLEAELHASLACLRQTSTFWVIGCWEM